MRILVVDDELEIRNVLRLLLENSGYEVEEAGDGKVTDTAPSICLGNKTKKTGVL